MGKQKRARQKYHLASVKSKLKDNDTASETGKSSASIKSLGPWKVTPSDGLFKNINIDVENLKKLSTADDDRRSVLSISKSIKRSIAESGTNIHLKKKDKLELRRNLFIKKVDAVHQLLQRSKKSKKGSNIESSETNLDELPQENMLFFKSEFKPPKGPKPVSKNRPTAKAKVRKQEMLKHLDIFKKVISEQKPLNHTLGAVTESIQQKLFNQEI